MGPGETLKIVQGYIVLPSQGVPPRAAQIVAQVEDISRADAPSIVIGEQHQTDVALQAGQVVPLRIEIPASEINERHSYSVRVHIDVSGLGKVAHGDLLSTQTYPVLTRGYGNEVRVNVRPV